MLGTGPRAPHEKHVLWPFQLSLISPTLFFFFFSLGGGTTPGGFQSLLLALQSGITPAGTQGTI